MKIVYMANSILPSKSANSVHVVRACQALAKQGHDVTLLCREGADANSDDLFEFYGIDRCFDIEAIPYGRIKGRFFIYLLRIIVMTFRLKPELIYSRFLIASFFTSVFYPTVFETHNPVWREGKLQGFLYRIMRKFFRTKRVVVITEALADAYVDYYGDDRGRYLVVPDGADSHIPNESNVSLLGGFSELNLGYVGHLYPGKGMEVIADLAPRLPECNFHIVGGLEEDVETWRQRLADCANVYFYGHVSPSLTGAYIAKMDVCLLPNQRIVRAHGASSDSNHIGQYTSPLKMFEYMSCGKAIIASDLPVLREILNEEVSCLADVDDIDKWVDAVNRCKDANFRMSLGENAKSVFEENYTWKVRMRKALEGLPGL